MDAIYNSSCSGFVLKEPAGKPAFSDCSYLITLLKILQDGFFDKKINF
jgi:hypothetical protein